MKSHLFTIFLITIVIVCAGCDVKYSDNAAVSEETTEETTIVTEDTADYTSIDAEFDTMDSSNADTSALAYTSDDEGLRGFADQTGDTYTVDLTAALSDRAIGNPDAPIKVEEFASLTCSHCATFHNEVFPSLQSNEIENGDVYFVYSDFPLNAPALDAAMLARCLPERHFFKFIKFLFKTQEEWAYDPDYRSKLIQNAKLVGATQEMAETCLANDALRQGLVDKLQNKTAEFEIKSTPSFIVNDAEVIKGVSNYDDFKVKLDAAAAE